jgi:type IV pilus assembly protein PilB
VKDDLSLLTRCKIEVVVASEPAILASIERHYGNVSTNIENLVTEIEESNETFTTTMQVEAEVVDEEAAADEGPIVKFVNAMLTDAIRLRASDIHIEPYEKRFRIRFRVDGGLLEKTQPPANAAAARLPPAMLSAERKVSRMRLSPVSSVAAGTTTS